LKAHIILLVSLSLSISCYSQIVQGKRCDIPTVLETEENLEILGGTRMFLFLYTFSEDCADNVEFQEYSNELLFKVLQKYPDLFLKTLSEDPKFYELADILRQLENPIHDQVNLEETLESISNSEGDAWLKKQIGDALLNAINKNK